MATLLPFVISRLTRPHGTARTALIIAELLIGVIALSCGILLTFGMLDMSRETLKDSPFNTFLIPGLLLTFAVGGSLLFAAYAEWIRTRFAPIASLLSGSVLLGWIVVEALMIHSGRGLQVTIFACALLIMMLSCRQLGRSDHPGTRLGGRDRSQA